MATLTEVIKLQDNMSKQLNIIQGHLNKLEREMGNTGKSVDTLSNKMSKAGSSASGFFSALMGAEVVKKGLSMITSQLDSAIQRYDTLNNFGKVMEGGFGIPAEDASIAIQYMSDKLRGLPTTTDAAASAVKRFVSSNGQLKRSTNMFLALNNAILAGGAPIGDQQSALEQLSQAYAKGKPDMMEWRTAMQAMPAQLKQVAHAMGYDSADSLGEALRKGTESMDNMLDAIMRLNDEGIDGLQSFAEQARNATGGIQTGIANMKSAVTRGLTEMLNKMDEGFKQAGYQNGIADFMKKIGTTIEKLLVNLAPKLVKLAEWLGNVLEWVADHIDEITTAVKGLLAVFVTTKVTGFFSSILTGASQAIGAFGGMSTAAAGVSTALSSVAGAFSIIGVVAGLAYTIVDMYMDGIRDKATEVTVAIDEQTQQTYYNIQSYNDTTLGVIMGSFMVLVGFFVEVIKAIIGLFAGLGSAVGAVFHNIGTAFKKLAAHLVNGFIDVVTNILSACQPLLDLVNNIAGTNFTADSIKSTGEKYKAIADDWAGDYEDVGAAFQKGWNNIGAFQGKEYKTASGKLVTKTEWFDEYYDIGSSFANNAQSKKEQKAKQQTDAINKELDDKFNGIVDKLSEATNNTNKLANATTGGGGSNSAIRTTTDDRLLKDEDIQLLLDVATRDYKLNYQQVTPQFTLTFGDIRETADVDDVLDKVADRLEEIYAGNLEVV